MSETQPDTLTITRLGLHGDGIAPGPVYAARTLPGEEIRGEITGDRIAAPKIVTPCPNRVKPPCPHYARCGGCALQHAADPFVADWKVQVVIDALSAHGLSAPMRPIRTSPPRTRRRATLSGRRLKKGTLLGFHTRASDTIVDIPGCEVLAPAITEALPSLAEFLPLLGSRKGELALAVTVSEAGLDVDIRGGKPLDPALRLSLTALTQRLDLARLSLDGKVFLTLRPPAQHFGPASVTPPPGAFLQATAPGEAALLAAVTEAVGPARRIADLFAGCGTFALPLATRAEVHAVEGDADMLAALDAGWRKTPGLSKVTTEARDLFRRPLLPDDLARFGAVVIDPPRAGAEAQTAALASAQPDRIAAVSCNPVTFARDAKTLCDAGYALRWVQVVDQFRWSPHVELAAAFTAPHIQP
ncbi:23S rRNA (uracil-5-)-methyltransferase RumA [Dinoroseobacter shibae DFL 12 = DSM 16493]|jgi:23S rRNA (uracil1939-C5)-methyltransferase|uniref:23S rRNA (Uracil-5-)-methyltransferase RumA n=1 Tax=Dinoroseobacter shibae (strain DSM 16493 / NCIMB 14021 / DFL 12) TaxID=398580 RepID=A8LPG0_DINSH|nr:class I SAM-dependent RNA methyltransferase [Dinoroseobacter shibae]ABV95225.1 23S rRNA (uracil-5-)-methyltransferase RumA [Dinoroseobacter shibae DFL 12 = DSM 16493]URF46638.1 class I SAM-dependent RNA methyltransferase [Dinoroseobacter shibae]URF50944.1 class I SAM-dependent RNA methyltransferase [Dinoroseobacter shibae]